MTLELREVCIRGASSSLEVDPTPEQEVNSKLFWECHCLSLGLLAHFCQKMTIFFDRNDGFFKTCVFFLGTFEMLTPTKNSTLFLHGKVDPPRQGKCNGSLGTYTDIAILDYVVLQRIKWEVSKRPGRRHRSRVATPGLRYKAVRAIKQCEIRKTRCERRWWSGRVWWKEW